MKLPFTHEQFLGVFQQYNLALWPVALFLWLLTLLALIYLYRRGVGGSRLIIATLALHWAWSGAVYHFHFFGTINPTAWIFAILFLIEALLFLRHAAGPSSLGIDPFRATWGRIGGFLIAYALVYPALGVASGLLYPRIPSFGVPCPTTILTIGVLLMVPRSQARPLAIIPIVWSIVGGSAAFILGVPADLGLIAAGGVLLAYVLSPAPKGLPRKGGAAGRGGIIHRRDHDRPFPVSAAAWSERQHDERQHDPSGA